MKNVFFMSQGNSSSLDSGTSSRQPAALFTSIADSMGKNEAVRNCNLLGDLPDFNTFTPTATLEIVNGGFRSQIGAHHD